MTEPTVQCPNCNTKIKLTESLAAPLITEIKSQFQEKLTQKDNDIQQKERELAAKARMLAESQNNLEQEINDKVAKQLQQERAKIIKEESTKLSLAWKGDLERQKAEVANLTSILQEQDKKLAEAQRAQTDFLKKERELQNAARELELTIEQRVQASLLQAREQAKREAEEALTLKVAEKDQTIASMQQKIEALRKQAEQGSQQLQGEAQELLLEKLLNEKFPFDFIEPVPKGEHGGDILQRVISSSGSSCGSILWETKRTKNWSDTWLVKLRDDQRTAKADIAVILSHTLPKNIQTFEFIDNVWVAHPSIALPIATLLRESLIEIARVRQSVQGQHTKTELIYQYLTGPQFRHRIEAIVEAFTSMQSDLDKEKKVIQKQWAKRASQIERVMLSTIGMYGDLQGIAGKSMQEIEGLDFNSLEGPDGEND